MNDLNNVQELNLLVGLGGISIYTTYQLKTKVIDPNNLKISKNDEKIKELQEQLGIDNQ